MSAGRRIALLAAVAVVAVVGFIILKPSDSSKKQSSVPQSAGATQKQPASAIQSVVVKGAKPAGGIKQLTFNKGDTVRFKVVSDVADEVHVHGYDIHKNVAPGKPVTFVFPGKIDGLFVVELESRGEQVASLRVNP